MPPNNAATVPADGAVDFPQDGPSTGVIIRTGVGTFLLPNIGTYRVAFTASVTEAGQLALSLDGTVIPRSVFGRATGTSMIGGEILVTTTVADSILEVVNPGPGALTITPLAGGAEPAAASLVIQQLD